MQSYCLKPPWAKECWGCDLLGGREPCQYGWMALADEQLEAEALKEEERRKQVKKELEEKRATSLDLVKNEMKHLETKEKNK